MHIRSYAALILRAWNPLQTHIQVWLPFNSSHNRSTICCFWMMPDQMFSIVKSDLHSSVFPQVSRVKWCFKVCLWRFLLCCVCLCSRECRQSEPLGRAGPRTDVTILDWCTWVDFMWKGKVRINRSTQKHIPSRPYYYTHTVKFKVAPFLISQIFCSCKELHVCHLMWSQTLC